MQIRGHEVVSVNKFNGRWNNGQNDIVPPDHAQDEFNCEYEVGAVKSRSGFNLHIAISASARRPKRVIPYYKSDSDVRLIYLDNLTNDIYDQSVSNTVPIKTFTSDTDDFVGITINGRFYFSPLDINSQGQVSEFLYVYDGTTVRKAAGAYPANAATFAAAASAGAGIVDKGKYIATFVYETDSGFITGADDNFILYSAPASKKIDFTNIANGPSGTAKKHILLTKVFHKAYSGNFRDYEFFFAGTINDNTTTSFTFNDYSNNLSESADYLFDQLEEIAAPTGLCQYNGSMVLVGETGNRAIARVSATGEPESFSAVDGFIIPGAGDNGGDLFACIEYRGQLNFHKAFRSYAAISNGLSPSEWPVTDLDKSIGCRTGGVSKVLDADGNSIDMYLLVSRQGLYLFAGAFDPTPITYKINDDYSQGDIGAFTEVYIDGRRKRIYLIKAGAGNYIFMGDYSEGLDPYKIKWSKWQLSFIPQSRGFMYSSYNGNSAELILHSTTIHNLYIYSDGATSDNSQAITSYYETAFLPEENAGIRNHYDAVRVRASGVGTLALTLTDQAGTAVTPTGFTLSTTPGTELERRININVERLKVKLGISGSTSARFVITALNTLVRAISTVLPS